MSINNASIKWCRCKLSDDLYDEDEICVECGGVMNKKQALVEDCIKAGWRWERWHGPIHVLIPPPDDPRLVWAAEWSPLDGDPNRLVPDWASPKSMEEFRGLK